MAITDDIQLSVIIPAFNEAKRIAHSIEEIVKYFSKIISSYEIIIVDDGSTDNMVSALQPFLQNNRRIKLIKNLENRGKGAAVQRGILTSRGTLIYFTDADLSTPIEELKRFLKEIENVDIVIGSRDILGSKIAVHEPTYREILGRIFCKIVNLFLVPGFKDTQCGAKMFRREVALNIFPKLKIMRFAFDVEILYLALKMTYKIKEVPVNWSYSKDTQVKVFQDGFKMLVDLIRIKWIHRKLT